MYIRAGKNRCSDEKTSPNPFTAAAGSACCRLQPQQGLPLPRLPKKYRRPLTETVWQLVQLNGQNLRPEPGTFTLTLSGDEGRVSGTGACNRLTGDYAADEKRMLKIGPVVTTRMACPEAEQERKFLEALEATTHYDMDGPMLMLLCDGELRAVLQALTE